MQTLFNFYFLNFVWFVVVILLVTYLYLFNSTYHFTMIEVGDEKAFVMYAENFIFKMQQLLREKDDFEGEALLPVCEKVEDYLFRKTLKECAPIDFVWMKIDAILAYQNKCNQILKNLGLLLYSYKWIFVSKYCTYTYAYEYTFILIHS